MEPKSDEEFEVFPFNTSFMVSKSGIVKGTKNGEILEQIVEKNHYYVKDPENDGKKEPVHRLVALTWLYDEYKKKRPYVHHKDGNNFNNHVNNLEWLSNKEHAESHGFQIDENDSWSYGL
jgi:hypothetical protein